MSYDELINGLALVVVENNRENFKEFGDGYFSNFGTDEETVRTVLSGVISDVTERVKELQK